MTFESGSIYRKNISEIDPKAFVPVKYVDYLLNVRTIFGMCYLLVIFKI